MAIGHSCLLGHGGVAREFSHVQQGHLKDYAGNPSTTQDMHHPKPTDAPLQGCNFPAPTTAFSFLVF